jgi:hypothetical protein
MHENSQDMPIDILEDEPADPIEMSPKAQSQPEAVPERAEPETSSKKYTNEDVYKMVSLVRHYPLGGHGGESFWNLMVKVYGSTLLEGRNGGGLRSRWRKTAKEHALKLEEYQKQLAANLSPEFVERVEKEIAAGIADTTKYELNIKAYSTLFPNAPKPLETSEKKTKRKKIEEGSAELVFPEERKKPRKSKMHVDLNSLLRKRDKLLPGLDVNTPEVANLIECAKNCVIMRDVNNKGKAIKSLKEVSPMEGTQLCKKIDLKREKFFKNSKPVPKPWTELEDTILRHQECTKVYTQLLKTKEKDKINKKNLFLGLT